MAQQLSVSINIESVDYTGRLPSGTEYTAANASGFDRGSYTLTPTVNINISDSNVATFSWGGYTGSSIWYVCSANGYHLDVQFSSNGSTWNTVSSAFLNNSQTQTCSSSYLTYQLIQDLVNALPSAQLNGSGQIRVVAWTLRAAPTTTLPGAFPNQAASEAVAADVVIELDYRPGAVWNGSNYMSCDRSGGVCNYWNGSAWTEMRTQDAPTGKGNPPLIFRDNDYYNMAKIGQE